MHCSRVENIAPEAGESTSELRDESTKTINKAVTPNGSFEVA
jgi:hypothetical protein